MEISFHSHLDSNTVIATKFCTWHDICAVVACAKICCDVMASNGVMARRSFHRVWIAGKKPLVKRAPAPCWWSCHYASPMLVVIIIITPAPCWWSYHNTSSVLVVIPLHQLHVGGRIITPAPCWWSYHYSSSMLVVISLHQPHVGGHIITPAPFWWSYHYTSPCWGSYHNTSSVLVVISLH